MALERFAAVVDHLFKYSCFLGFETHNVSHALQHPLFGGQGKLLYPSIDQSALFYGERVRDLLVKFCMLQTG